MKSLCLRFGACGFPRGWWIFILPLILLPSLTAGMSFLFDLNGWWRVVDDNDHLVKIIHEGSDVTLLDGDGSLIGEGTVSNDTVFFLLTPSDTAVFIYHSDTLRGHNQQGETRTLVRYPVDLNGWWKEMVGSFFLELVHQGAVVSFWDMEGAYMGEGTFQNDTLYIPGPPPTTDTMFLVYAADTLRGQDLDSNSMIMARAPLGPWPPIQCGTIMVDGETGDWPESFLIAEDLNGDGTSGPSAELLRLYLCSDDEYLYFRIDLEGDVAFPHSGGYYDRYSIFISNQRYGQFDYQIRIWDFTPINFRDNNTGDETTLDIPGISGSTMEGRIPLYLLEDIDTAYVSVESEYYDAYLGWWYYDRIDQPGVRSGCISGDANGDGQVNVGDAVFLISYIFKGGPAPDPVCIGDANGDGNTNVGDAVYLISYIFKGGPPPVMPSCP